MPICLKTSLCDCGEELTDFSRQDCDCHLCHTPHSHCANCNGMLQYPL